MASRLDCSNSNTNPSSQQAIYRAAEAPNRFFVVLSGTVDLYQPKHETPEEIARAK